MKKRVVVALGHRALGTTLPEQKEAVKKTAKVIADMVAAGYQAAITHSTAPQVGKIQCIREGTSGLYGGAYVCVLCHEPGIYRL